ncbi:YceG family protein [Peptococcaceae bacterium 1198_IL3148]
MKIRRSNQQTALNQANDIFNDILLPSKKRTRGTVYFYRLIGFNNQSEFLTKVTLLHQQLLKYGDLYLYFIDSLPLPFNNILTDKISQGLTDLNSTDPTVICDVLTKASLLPTVNSQMTGSLKTILDLYIKNEPTVNISQLKNFVTKILLWAHQHVPTLYRQSNANHNPKVLYYGEIKKHSIYFLIFLSQLGCDVLYINPYSDSDYQNVDPNNQFSQIIEGSIKTKLAEPPIKVMAKSYVRPITTGPCVAVKLKKATDIWQDILLPLHKRSGYLGSPTPVLPIYFYRHIGLAGTSNESVDQFYNTIYQLDRTLTNGNYGYIRLTDFVPMPSNSDIAHYKTKLHWNGDQNSLISGVLSANILPITNSKSLNNTIKTAFQQTMELFIDIEPNSSSTRLENFALKLIGWINNYFYDLYIDFDFKDSPKVLYYGDIKLHEICFLIYLSKIGCDVLYINTDCQKDNIFKEIDPAEQHSKLITQPYSLALEPFPEVERVIRKATVAYSASQEIQQVIYSADAGLFKPWQFQNYRTQPITLRTTYDELKILWPEEARIRPEFKVVDDTVYVPNLFAKIRGTHQDLNLYWQDYRLLINSKNTLVVTQVPFTKVNYKKRDLYASAFLFNNDGLLNREKLMQSGFYRFSYLRSSLQHLIISKVEELIKANPFIDGTDKELPLKILMTVMTMDDNILRLIETFDYPKEVPKLVIYDSTKEVFSDEDAIIIAFLNLVGIDIAIFTPTNYNNIELKLKTELLDEHQLPSLQLDLPIPDSMDMPNESSKIGNLFNQISTKIRRKFR